MVTLVTLSPLSFIPIVRNSPPPFISCGQGSIIKIFLIQCVCLIIFMQCQDKTISQGNVVTWFKDLDFSFAPVEPIGSCYWLSPVFFLGFYDTYLVANLLAIDISLIHMRIADWINSNSSIVFYYYSSWSTGFQLYTYSIHKQIYLLFFLFISFLPGNSWEFKRIVSRSQRNS